MRRLFILLLLMIPTTALGSVGLRIQVWPSTPSYSSYPLTQQVWVRRTIDRPATNSLRSTDSTVYRTHLGQQWRRSTVPQEPESNGTSRSEQFVERDRQSTVHSFRGGHPNYRVLRTLKVVATAYNSRRNQTDSTPWRTANSRLVRDGDIACNFLPLGTLVRITDGPDLIRGKIFRVEDRLANPPPLGWNQIDIWMLRVSDAIAFGKKNLTLEVLGDPAGEAPR